MLLKNSSLSLTGYLKDNYEDTALKFISFLNPGIWAKFKNSDAKNNKLTYIDIIGLGEAKLKAKKLTDSALNSINQSNITNIDKLIEMAKYLISRES